MSYFFTVPDYNYRLRMKKATLSNFAGCLIFALFTLILVNWSFALLFGAFLFITQQIKLSVSEKYFVVKLNIDDQQIEMTYDDKGERKQINGVSQDFTFSKKFSISRTRDPYLKITFRNDLIIKQYKEKEWSEKKMDETVAIFNNSLIG